MATASSTWPSPIRAFDETISYPDGSFQVINVQGGVSVLLGNGDGTFQPPIYDPVEPANILVAGDFNGDGKLDLAIMAGI